MAPLSRCRVMSPDRQHLDCSTPSASNYVSSALSTAASTVSVSRGCTVHRQRHPPPRRVEPWRYGSHNSVPAVEGINPGLDRVAMSPPRLQPRKFGPHRRRYPRPQTWRATALFIAAGICHDFAAGKPWSLSAKICVRPCTDDSAGPARLAGAGEQMVGALKGDETAGMACSAEDLTRVRDADGVVGR
jgi:hypothetical protein